MLFFAVWAGDGSLRGPTTKKKQKQQKKSTGSRLPRVPLPGCRVLGRIGFKRLIGFRALWFKV